jgi:tRNA-splicing ligase RtcB
MKVISTEKKPIKTWCNEPEEGAIEQAKNLANLPFIFKHVALMPDTHQGYGMPIGGVIATEGVIIPNAVGVDIGCGMCAVKTNLKVFDLGDDLGNIMRDIRQAIPLGMNHHKEDQEWEGFINYPDIDILCSNMNKAKRSLGTLGGGNHFIEIQKDTDNNVWIMLHSGSRNLGKQIADHYNKKALTLCKMWHSNVYPLEGNDVLPFLPLATQEGKEYLEAMNFALDFALANRMQMINKCKEAFQKYIDCEFGEVINIHHNYAAMENHFGKNVMVHRKGATSARKGQYGIIPGSQGTSSYIVEGLGNPDSFMSCSHGAGRKMSRKAARENLSVEEEVKLLNDQGIKHAIRNVSDLDEAPSAYKDIKTVMEEQEDLVKILVELKPLGVIKG